jgi:hypothetical protein
LYVARPLGPLLQPSLQQQAPQQQASQGPGQQPGAQQVYGYALAPLAAGMSAAYAAPGSTYHPLSAAAAPSGPAGPTMQQQQQQQGGVRHVQGHPSYAAAYMPPSSAIAGQPPGVQAMGVLGGVAGAGPAAGPFGAPAPAPQPKMPITALVMPPKVRPGGPHQ